MGFWSTLGRIALPVASIAAAPFSGGTSLLGLAGMAPKVIGGIQKAADIAGAVAPVLGGAAKGKQQVQTDKVNSSGNDLAAANFNAAAPGRRLNTGANAALASAGPATAQWGGKGSGLRGQTLKFSGGANAAAGDPRLKQLADQVMAGQIEEQMGGAKMVAPQVAGQSSSVGDKILGGSSFVASILAALGQNGLENKRRQQGGQPMDEIPNPIEDRYGMGA